MDVISGASVTYIYLLSYYTAVVFYLCNTLEKNEASMYDDVTNC